MYYYVKGNSLQFLCTPYIWKSQSIFNIKQIFTNSFQLNGWLLSFEIRNSSNCILPGLSSTRKKKIQTHPTQRRRRKKAMGIVSISILSLQQTSVYYQIETSKRRNFFAFIAICKAHQIDGNLRNDLFYLFIYFSVLFPKYVRIQFLSI